MNVYSTRVVTLLSKDSFRLRALDCVYELGLPDCYLAAGFVRNMVWDDLHKIWPPTPLEDIDVIYFDVSQQDSGADKALQSKLCKLMPELNWQVKNQARMHERNLDKPYISTLDAMGYWPEKETAVGVRRVESGSIECISAFGLESLFNGKLTRNPKRSQCVFEQRIEEKKWLGTWSQLKISKAVVV